MDIIKPTEDDTKDRIIQLEDGRKIVTSDLELKKIILALREYLVKFGDFPRLMTEHSYLFKNIDPIWGRSFNIYATTIGVSNSVYTFNFKEI